MPSSPIPPKASRPYMPGYGVVGPEEGSGLLPWSWAEERLERSHDYWVATVWPDGRPHVMPLWGVWLDGAAWFSSSRGSRKVRNLLADPRCVVTTDNAQQPVVVEGRAERVTEHGALVRLVEAFNRKYGEYVTVEFVAENAAFRVPPTWVFALDEDDFSGSPTRWRFAPS